MKTRFNCVDMKHKSADFIQKQLKGYSTEQELKFWQERSNDLKNKKNEMLKKVENSQH